MPSENLVSDVSTEELKGNGQLHGVSRGSSLPCDRNMVDRDIVDPTAVGAKVKYEGAEETVTETCDETAVAGDTSVSRGISVDGDKSETLLPTVDATIGKRKEENVPLANANVNGPDKMVDDEKTALPSDGKMSAALVTGKTPSPDNAETPISDCEKTSLSDAVPTGTSDGGVESASPSSDDVKTPVSDDRKTVSSDDKNTTPVSETAIDTPTVDAEAEYRLTMIQSVREAVNRICEQAVEQTAAIVKSGRGRSFLVAAASGTRYKRDADDSEAADYESSEFSLPPPPPQSSRPSLQPNPSVDTVSDFCNYAAGPNTKRGGEWSVVVIVSCYISYTIRKFVEQNRFRNIIRQYL